MKGAWILVFSLAMPLALGMSQPPSQTPSKSAAQQQQTGSEKDSDTKVSNPRSAAAGAHINEFVANVQTQYGHDESADHHWSLVIAALTCAAIFAQVFVYLRQSKIMQRTLETMNASAALARKEFNIVHAPKLFVRHFFATAYPEGRQATVSFELCNEGDQAAVLNFEEATFIAKIEYGNAPEFPPTVFDNYKNHPSEIQVGEERRYKVHINNTILGIHTRASDWRVWAAAETQITFEFRGHIPYTDAAGETRHCAFDVRYNFVTALFEWVDGPQAPRPA